MPININFLLGSFVFLFGLAWGSFLNVIVFRFNTGESFLSGRSHCFSCSRQLRFYELIPVLSFLIQGGKCRNCQSKISLQYLLVELSLGILYLLFYLRWVREFGSLGTLPILLWWFIIGFLAMALSVYDFKHHILPDKFIYIFIALALLGNLIFIKPSLLHIVLGLIPALFLFLLWLFSGGRWMGLGDSKLMLGGAFFLGWPKILEALFFGFWSGAVCGILLLVFGRVRSLKSEIPFGPFLVFGLLLAFFLPDFLLPYFYIT